MKKILFQYAVLWHPTNEQSKEGVESKMITAPSNILGKSEKSTVMEITMDINKEYKNQLDQVEILIRPF